MDEDDGKGFKEEGGVIMEEKDKESMCYREEDSLLERC